MSFPRSKTNVNSQFSLSAARNDEDDQPLSKVKSSGAAPGISTSAQISTLTWNLISVRKKSATNDEDICKKPYICIDVRNNVAQNSNQHAIPAAFVFLSART